MRVLKLRQVIYQLVSFLKQIQTLTYTSMQICPKVLRILTQQEGGIFNFCTGQRTRKVFTFLSP